MITKSIRTLMLIPILALSIAACQPVTLTVQAPTGAGNSQVELGLTVPPRARNHARAGETPINPQTLRDRFLSSNPQASFMAVVGVPSVTGFALSRGDLIEYTYDGITNNSPVAFSSGNRVCTDVSEEKNELRWRGVCFSAYERTDGSIRIVIEVGRQQKVKANFVSRMTPA